MSLPSLSPIQAPDLICTECSKILRRALVSRANGKIEKIIYYCDTEKCHYGVTLSGVHASTQNAPYVSPEPPSQVQSHKRMVLKIHADGV